MKRNLTPQQFRALQQARDRAALAAQGTTDLTYGELAAWAGPEWLSTLADIRNLEEPQQ